MFNRLIHFILVGTLLLQMGCTKTVYTVWPVPHQDPGLSIASKVKVTLKHKTLLHGRYRGNAIAWRTDKISGELLASNEEVVSIRTDIRRTFEVPIEDIEKIEIVSKSTGRDYGDYMVKGCLIAGIAGVAMVVYILISCAGYQYTPN